MLPPALSHLRSAGFGSESGCGWQVRFFAAAPRFPCIGSALQQPRPVRPDEVFEYKADDDLSFEIFLDDDGVYVVVGGLVDMLCRNVVLNNPDSMQYFQKVLRLRGVIKELSKMGCQEGDTVSIGDVEFEFVL